MLEPDRAARIEKARAANRELLRVVDAFEARRLDTTIVAAGGLGTWDITGANPRITEIHAGSYIFSDAFHLSLVPGFEPALAVLATVTARHGGIAVLDCGRKSIGIDRAAPVVVSGPGAVRHEHGEHFIHEEHTVLDVPPESSLGVGDRVELMPGYAPTTVNLYDRYHVVRDGRIADVWPILGRYGADTTVTGPA
jgi:D-threonine aldolase